MHWFASSPLLDSLPFWSKRFSLFRFLQRNDFYSDSLYVLRSFLTLAVIPVLGFSDFRIVL